MTADPEYPRLRELRRELGWTQQEMADRLAHLAWMDRREHAAVNADMVAAARSLWAAFLPSAPMIERSTATGSGGGPAAVALALAPTLGCPVRRPRTIRRRVRR